MIKSGQELQCVKLSKDVKIPEKVSGFDSLYDIFLVEDTVFKAGRTIIDSGLTMNFGNKLYPSMTCSNKKSLSHSLFVVDYNTNCEQKITNQDTPSRLKYVVINSNKDPIRLKKGDSVARLMLYMMINVDIVEKKEFSKAEFVKFGDGPVYKDSMDDIIVPLQIFEIPKNENMWLMHQWKGDHNKIEGILQESFNDVIVNDWKTFYQKMNLNNITYENIWETLDDEWRVIFKLCYLKIKKEMVQKI